jgi:Cytochrome c
MNGYLKWFQRLTWVGVIANLISFVLPALFSPDTMEALLGPGSTEFALYWVPYTGFVLLCASLMYLPAAVDPLGRHVYAWLSVVGRGLAAIFWLTQISRWGLSGMISTFWVLDTTCCVVFLILLQLGMPPEWKISGANLGRVFASWGTAFTRLFTAGSGTPQDPSNPSLRAFGIVAWLVTLGTLAFSVLALVTPATFNPKLGGVTDVWAYLWLGNCALLLIQLCVFLWPAASYPVRYRVYAWGTVAAWLGSALFWLFMTRKWALTAPVSRFWVLDLAVAVVLGFLLHRGLPAEYRLSGAGLKRWLSSVFGAFKKLVSEPLTAVLLVAALALGGALAYGLYVNLLKVEPDTVFSDPAEMYKYGAIGLAIEARVPLYLWEVVPELCGDKMPDPALGWASFGLLYEPGKSLPIGFAQRQIGYPTVEPTCSLCHTANFRTAEGGAQQIAAGGPAHALDLQGFQWFLYDCAQSPGFTPKAVVAKIAAKHPELSWFQKKIYEFAIIPSAQMGLKIQSNAYAWQKTRPEQGRGRTDTFNPTKITVFRLPDDGTIGTVDLPAVWNQRAREGMWLHWDGNNDDIHERNYAAAMAVGATPRSVVPANFQKITDYLLTLPPPKFPFPVDTAKSERGWTIFEANCANCHAFGSPKVGTVTDIAEIGTDSHRLNSFTEQLVGNFHTVHEGLFQFDSYRKTQGYSNLPIDGTWARSPYLHNGSVPTLWDLLQKPPDRPTKFWKGYEVYDPVKMGFVTSGAGAEALGFQLDTTVPGNGNGGHLYGTDLTEAEKWDLIEYLKTL